MACSTALTCTSTASAAYVCGVQAQAIGNAVHNSYGLYSLSVSSATNSYGVLAAATGNTANGKSYGVYGNSSSESGSNYGVCGRSNGLTNGTNIGVYGTAYNGGTNWEVAQRQDMQ